MQDNPDDRDAEARVNAIKGLVSVCEILTDTKNTNFGGDDMALLLLIKDEVMMCLLKALDDYSVDNRGDVGSWVREVAMDGLARCAFILCKRDSVNYTGGSVQVESAVELHNSDIIQNNQLSPIFDANLATNIVGGICKQAVEKMDKLREAAAKVLQRILYNKIAYIPHISHRKKLEKLVPDSSYLTWGVSIWIFSSSVFPRRNLVLLQRGHFLFACRYPPFLFHVSCNYLSSLAIADQCYLV